MNKYFDWGTVGIIVATLILFIVALFVKGLTHDILLEVGVFLVSANALLKKYVVSNGVNFKGLCQDKRLDQYLSGIAKTDPAHFSTENEQLAFWINVYNAYTLKAICDKYPVRNMAHLGFGPLLISAALGKTVWDKPLVVVDHKKYSLKNIDHTVIRGRFKDPKIQFALYCGAVSCPPLRNEVYEAARLQEQMMAQANIFFNSSQWNTFDLESKTANLSPVLNWNAKYFGENQKDIVKFIAGFAPEDVRESLRNQQDSWTIQYNKYDLTINDAR